MNLKCQILAALVASYAITAANAAQAKPEALVVNGMTSFSDLAEKHPESIAGLIGAGRAIRTQSVHVSKGQIVISASQGKSRKTDVHMAKADVNPLVKEQPVVVTETAVQEKEKIAETPVLEKADVIEVAQAIPAKAVTAVNSANRIIVIHGNMVSVTGGE